MTKTEHWPANTDRNRTPPQVEVVILAAGQGQRFEASGGQGHKALAPIWDQRGTLELLLSRLRKCGNQHEGQFGEPRHLPVTVVTGRWADSIQAVAQRYNANVVHNPDHANATLLQSLVYAIKHRCTNRVSGASCVGCVRCGICVCQADRVLVLFADTLYSLKALQTLVQACMREAKSDPGLECLSTGQETRVSTSHHSQNPPQIRSQPCALVAISPAPAKHARLQVMSTAVRSVRAEDARGDSVDSRQASASTDSHYTEGAWPEQTRVHVTDDNKVLRFDDPDSEWQMAHAVVWPRHMMTRLVEAVDVAQQTNVSRQWQVLQQIIETASKPATSAVRAVRLPAWSTFDVDTIDDLTALQHDHRVHQEHLEYFDSHVSKERTLGSEPDALLDQVYRKYCESPSLLDMNSRCYGTCTQYARMFLQTRSVFTVNVWN
ncbi:NTP transferase domain-containing protein [Orrella marina]|nr:NTP transferase domain-containing protein [Orrella marina]